MATHNIKEDEDEEYAYSLLSSLPPGFLFEPRDHELILHYLTPKINNSLLPTNLIHDVNIYKYTPDFLAATKRAQGDKKWYFFTPRERKYPKGKRPNREANGGYWKATQRNKPIMHLGVEVGFKQALTYYRGKAPKGVKTSWLMQEFKLSYDDTSQVVVSNNRKRDHDGDYISMRLDDYVLCRIYRSDRGTSKYHMKQQEAEEEDIPLQEVSSVDTTYPNNEIVTQMYKQVAQKEHFLLPAVPSVITSYNTTTAGANPNFCFRDQMEPSTNSSTNVGSTRSSFQSGGGFEIVPLITSDNIANPTICYCDQMEPSTNSSTNVGTSQSSFQSGGGFEIVPFVTSDNIANPSSYCSDREETSVTCLTDVGTSQYCFQSSDNVDILPLAITSYNTTKLNTCCSDQKEQAISWSINVGTSQYYCQSSDSTHIVPPVVPPVSNYNMSNPSSNSEKVPLSSCSSTNNGTTAEKCGFKRNDSNQSVDDLLLDFDMDSYLANL